MRGKSFHVGKKIYCGCFVYFTVWVGFGRDQCFDPFSQSESGLGICQACHHFLQPIPPSKTLHLLLRAFQLCSIIVHPASKRPSKRRSFDNPPPLPIYHENANHNQFSHKTVLAQNTAYSYAPPPPAGEAARLQLCTRNLIRGVTHPEGEVRAWS